MVKFLKASRNVPPPPVWLHLHIESLGLEFVQGWGYIGFGL